MDDSNDYAMIGMCCYLPNHPIFNNHYEPISPKDFDFACSYDWRAYYTETMEGIYLLPLERKEEEIEPEETEETERPFTPRPIVNITYKVRDIDTPAFKQLQTEISKLKGRLSRYFEHPDKKKDRYTKYIS